MKKGFSYWMVNEYDDDGSQPYVHGIVEEVLDGFVKIFDTTNKEIFMADIVELEDIQDEAYEWFVQNVKA